MTLRCAWSSLALIVGACAAPAPDADTGLEGLAVEAVSPDLVLPGTTIAVTGRSFVDARFGASRLRLVGAFDGTHIDVALSATFVDYGRLEVKVDPAALGRFPRAPGRFDGDAVVEVDSTVDGQTHASAPLAVELEVAETLVPEIMAVGAPPALYVNDPVIVDVAGILLGDEGSTVAVISGCVQRLGGAGCALGDPVEVPVLPVTPNDRTHGAFAFRPEIAGIRPGTFRGTVRLRNVHGGGEVRESADEPFQVELLLSAIEGTAPSDISLGQYLDVRGGGFTEDTVLRLRGTFTPKGGGGVTIDTLLVPEFVAGPRVRYVVNEDDPLGQTIDLRRTTGVIDGTLAPIVYAGGDRVEGDETPVRIRLAPVKQVVYVQFLPSYVESLRYFGLRALDDRIRARVLEVARRDYATINVEFRDAPPTDFALYAQVDIAGPDPNGKGLFGLDNTPGKDSGNERLHDRIGGVNAETQEDGHDGYGGVFIESLFAFSEHPNGHADPISGTDAAFDRIFDAFRPDRGGRAVVAADFSGAGIPTLASSDGCLAEADRARLAACAAWVLGSLVGTTMTHEVGHSLGLANPESTGDPHDFGDAPNRIMDAGGYRPFRERAELDGQGPARFCDDEYEYLRDILPTDEPADAAVRPGCF